MAIESSNAQRLTAVMSTTSAIAVLMSFLTHRTEASGSDIVSLDDATLKLLAAMAISIDNIDNDADLLADILSAIQNISISGGSEIIPNNKNAITNVVQGALAAKAYRLPDTSIPLGRTLTIKSYPTNAGIVYVARSASEAINWQQAWPLMPNESIGYRVNNAREFWVSFAVAGESAVFTVEQD
jgi:hypothetical protein